MRHIPWEGVDHLVSLPFTICNRQILDCFKPKPIRFYFFLLIVDAALRDLEMFIVFGEKNEERKKTT